MCIAQTRGSVARLRSGARKHYSMRSALCGIYLNAHSALCMSGAARVTVVPYIHFAHDILKFSRIKYFSDWPNSAKKQIVRV